MNESLKVQAHHLERSAYLYIRQSSMRQVLENVESVSGGWGRDHFGGPVGTTPPGQGGGGWRR